jgi:rhodanese-related sulfurtransferase
MVAVAAPGAADVETIPAGELRARLGDPLLTPVSVLTPQQFAKARIPGSVNLPYADLERRAPDILPDRNREFAVYCGSFS